ncbi:hypothetical protein [Streptosporangium sp. NPDC051022]|uniref:hypothetical protein n=1 Tax=Streptosporangium sp. NPDC051022 TaxID=3155752 RepID=UPI00343F1B63
MRRTATEPADGHLRCLPSAAYRPGAVGGLVTALGYFGITPTAARVTLARLVQRGLAERHRKGRFVYYTSSERCLHLLENSEKRIFELSVDNS